MPEADKESRQTDQPTAENGLNNGKTIFSSDDHYLPKRGTKIHKCNYIIVEDLSAPVPAGFVPLVDGHPVLVSVPWLSTVQGAYKGKTKSCALKLMFNGFFQPKEVIGKTGSEVAETIVGKAIMAYALKVFGMDVRGIIACYNSKIGTMVRAYKRDTI